MSSSRCQYPKEQQQLDSDGAAIDLPEAPSSEAPPGLRPGTRGVPGDAASSVMPKFVRRALRWAQNRAARMNEVLIFALLLGALMLYSVALSKVSLRVVQFVFGNGVMQDTVQMHAFVRGIADFLDAWLDGTLRIIMLPIKLMVGLALAPLLAIIGVLLAPGNSRFLATAVFACTASVAAAHLGIFAVADVALPPGALSSTPHRVAAAAGLSAVGVAVGLVVGRAAAPELTEWCLGGSAVLSAAFPVVVMITALVSAALTVLHLEGQATGDRIAQGPPRPKTVATTHAATTALIATCAVLIALSVPAMNPKIAARLQMLAWRGMAPQALMPP